MKRLLLLICPILLSAGIQAQSWYEAGIRAGANFSMQTHSGIAADVETSWRPAFHMGIFGSLFYNEKLALQLEFLYSEKGSMWTDLSFSGEEVLSYVDVPLTANMQILDLLSVHAGPQFSFLTGAWRMPDDGVAYSVREYYEGVDVGLLAGAALTLPFRLNITLRYVEGLIVTTDPRFYTERWKNRVVQLSLSYPIFGD